MIVRLFSPAYVLSLIAAFALTFALYFALRKRSEWSKKTAVAILIGLNIFQHFFKSTVYPHLWGTGFGLENTAYNMCAALILVSPFACFGKSKVWKQFIAYVGSTAGIIALLYPYWFIGKTIFQWEFVRFWTCHAILFASSLLPALWKLTTFRYTDGWKFGGCGLCLLCVLLLNNVVFLLAFGKANGDTLYEELVKLNPLWIMQPPDNPAFAGIASVFALFTPGIFLGAKTGVYTPILWYAIPMYLVLTVLCFLVGGIVDRKRFVSDFRLVFGLGNSKRKVRVRRPEYLTRTDLHTIIKTL